VTLVNCVSTAAAAAAAVMEPTATVTVTATATATQPYSTLCKPTVAQQLPAVQLEVQAVQDKVQGKVQLRHILQQVQGRSAGPAVYRNVG
jgi:hypothetical protein